MTGDHLPQWKITFGSAVLQSLRAMLFQDNIAGFLKLFDRKYFGCGQPPAKRDDVWLLGEFEQFTDNGTAHTGRSVCVTVFPGCGMVHSCSLE